MVAWEVLYLLLTGVLERLVKNLEKHENLNVLIV